MAGWGPYDRSKLSGLPLLAVPQTANRQPLTANICLEVGT